MVQRVLGHQVCERLTDRRREIAQHARPQRRSPISAGTLDGRGQLAAGVGEKYRQLGPARPGPGLLAPGELLFEGKRLHSAVEHAGMLEVSIRASYAGRSAALEAAARSRATKPRSTPARTAAATASASSFRSRSRPVASTAPGPRPRPGGFSGSSRSDIATPAELSTKSVFTRPPRREYPARAR